MVAFLGAFAFEWFEASNVVTRALVGIVCCTIAILIGWSGYVSWHSRPAEVPEEERPLAYIHPNDPYEEVVDEAEEVGRGNTEEQSRSRRPPVLMAIRRFLQFPNPFKPVLMEGNV